METERVRRKFALKTRKWMEMGLGKRGGLDWIPKICPVKGSTFHHITKAQMKAQMMTRKYTYSPQQLLPSTLAGAYYRSVSR